MFRKSISCLSFWVRFWYDLMWSYNAFIDDRKNEWKNEKMNRKDGWIWKICLRKCVEHTIMIVSMAAKMPNENARLEYIIIWSKILRRFFHEKFVGNMNVISRFENCTLAFISFCPLKYAYTSNIGTFFAFYRKSMDKFDSDSIRNLTDKYKYV